MVMPQVATQQHILEFLRVAEIHLQHMDIAINNATAAGNTHLAESLKKEKSTKLLNHQKYKAVLASMAQSQQLALSRSVTQETEGEGGTSAMPNSSASSNHPSSSPSNKDLNPAPLGSENNGIANSVVPGHDPQALSQLAQSRMAISTFPPLPNTNPNPPLASVPPPGLQVPPSVSPQLAAQMQKLFDQQRNRPPHLGGPPLPHQQGLTHSEQQQSSSNMSAAGDHLRTTPVWQGLLTWTGFDAATQGRKEVHAQVAAYLQTSSNTDSFVFFLPFV
jgi:mediator of RNA polymerase II transcription subunit 25